jgi:hypothetical protein
MVGAIPGNLHEGSRSEILADYFFSRWGAVTPVRRQDDCGVDLLCTLTERVRGKDQVREYFTVQVKSTDDAWTFEDRDSVRWLIEYPTPLFLCTVSKKDLRIRVYHVFPRFVVWSLGDLPETLELTPGQGPTGKFVEWADGSSFSLSAPIIEASVDDLMDDDQLVRLRDVFTHWVRFDRENCDLIRQGLLMFRMSEYYTVNEIPETRPIVEQSYGAPSLEFLNRGLLRLAEALNCIGGQRGMAGDRAFALEAALLLDRIQTKHADVVEVSSHLQSRVSGQIGQVVNNGLNKALGQQDGVYHYTGIEEIEKMIENCPLVKKYVADGTLPP